jgi:hypothetical protein
MKYSRFPRSEPHEISEKHTGTLRPGVFVIAKNKFPERDRLCSFDMQVAGYPNAGLEK